VTHISTALSLIMCLAMSLSGFLVFTDKTQANILNNFPQSDILINLARLCFVSGRSLSPLVQTGC
jgi:solute carrier family 38 (sodium-coupled neutral amino acid transporter), member 11